MARVSFSENSVVFCFCRLVTRVFHLFRYSMPLGNPLQSLTQSILSPIWMGSSFSNWTFFKVQSFFLQFFKLLYKGWSFKIIKDLITLSLKKSFSKTILLEKGGTEYLEASKCSFCKNWNNKGGLMLNMNIYKELEGNSFQDILLFDTIKLIWSAMTNVAPVSNMAHEPLTYIWDVVHLFIFL